MARNILEKLKCLIFNKTIRFSYLTKLGFYNKMDDEKFLKKKFKIIMGKNLDLDNPKTMNEKLQWLKLNDRKNIYTTMVDKYKVRDYIKEQIGEEYLIPLIGVYDSPDDINFEKLPDKFVLKCNHNSGLGMCICKDKSKLDIKRVKRELKKGLKQDYFLTGREWPYKNVDRKIICEKYMEDSEYKELRDYKFYCFNGMVKFFMINSDRFSSDDTKGDYFDREFNWLDFTWGFNHAKIKPKIPENVNKMIEISDKLSKGTNFLRVDLYNIDGKIYFGELTFYDGSGFDKIEPLDWEYKIGNMLNFNKEK